MAVLSEQVSELREEVKVLQLSVSGALTLEHRMKAVEAQLRSHDVRMEHIDRIVMSIQHDIQKLQKNFGVLTEMRLADAKKLDDIHALQMRMLDLLQPKVTVGP